MQKTQSNRDPLSALALRLAAVERSNHRLRAVVSALVLLAAAVVTAGATVLVPDTIAARSFRLVDGAGAERVALTTGDHGTAVLTLSAGARGRAFTITLAPVAPFVVVADSEGKSVSSTSSPTPSQPATEPEKRGRIGWGKPAPAGGKEEDDDSFDWAD